MRTEKRRGGPVLFAGLGGFALGAATVLFVVWVYGAKRPAAPSVAPAAPPAGVLAPPASSPAAPAPEPPAGVRGPRMPQQAPAPDAAGSAPPAATPGNGAASPTLPAPAPPATTGEIDDLRRRNLLLPVQGVRREQLNDTFNDGRGNHLHEALDILAPRNTPVLAVEDGRLVKLFVSRQGGNTIYQFDPSETYTYYYAHLDRYADGVREGALLRRGQVIGYVGTSGNAPPETPHLHFAIFRLNPDKRWWQGTAIDPYTVLSKP